MGMGVLGVSAKASWRLWDLFPTLVMDEFGNWNNPMRFTGRNDVVLEATEKHTTCKGTKS